MARENRAENRRAAKEAAGEKMEEADLLEEAFSGDDDGDDEQDTPPPGKIDDDNDPDTEIEIDEVENALEGKTPPPASVDKKADEDVGKTEDAKEPEKKEETPPSDKKPEEVEKKPEDKAKEAEPGKPAEPAAKTEEKKVEEKKEEEKPKELTNEEAIKLFSDWRTETEDLLAQNHYRMSEKDVEEFNENPAAWVPKAMSRVYLDSISASFQQFVTYLPNMIDQVLEGRKQRSAKEDAFFGRWPKLKEHKEAVYRLGTTYRQSNPTASLEQFISEVGALAHVALRIAPDDMPQATPPAPPQKPFVPAGTSPAANPPPPRKQPNDNVFASLANEFAMSMEDLPDGN